MFEILYIPKITVGTLLGAYEGLVDGIVLGADDSNIVGADEGIAEGTVVLQMPHLALQVWKTPAVLHNVSLH